MYVAMLVVVVHDLDILVLLFSTSVAFELRNVVLSKNVLLFNQERTFSEHVAIFVLASSCCRELIVR